MLYSLTVVYRYVAGTAKSGFSDWLHYEASRRQISVLPRTTFLYQINFHSECTRGNGNFSSMLKK